VTASAGCGGALGVSFDVTIRKTEQLGCGDRHDEVTAAGSVSATFAGFVGCGSGRPGSRELAVDPAAFLDPAAAEVFRRQQVGGGGAGCGP